MFYAINFCLFLGSHDWSQLRKPTRSQHCWNPVWLSSVRFTALVRKEKGKMKNWKYPRGIFYLRNRFFSDLISGEEIPLGRVRLLNISKFWGKR